ncbi:hypothetical protein HF1_11360 [Mycoplasma haemofelis str. Langford 1]|uniref:Uncharacterized protein n=1 Tax=Mycoplasma haemofelis (strain Langford 1) TaxID=941640 RepID=E8ZJ23_MYCHL|nr:hypothetical protein [Mycoplasma haemofelis]CBY93144.1 hypothetical protein HF1_11360 [Mycoplasma haemofelis str. Langford 1]
MKLGNAVLLGGASVTGASAAAGGYYALKPKGITIKEELQNRRFISESDTAQWDEEFKSDKENIKAVIKELSGVDDKDGGIKLRDWCSKQMILEARKYSESLELVRKYCLIRDLASQLLRKGKTLLTSDSSSEDWSNTYKYRKSKSTSRADVGLNDQWASDPNTQETKDLEIIKAWCLKTSGEEFLASDKDAKYDKLHKWCTKEGKSVD